MRAPLTVAVLALAVIGCLVAIGWGAGHDGAGAAAPASQGGPAPSASGPSIHMLLIGASHYPYLDERWRLEGPPNDVRLLHEVLTTGGFPVDQRRIRILSGWPENADDRPTRANILRELHRLAREDLEGAQVLIYFAGHGSQQPANDDPDEDEWDGFDELLLPADVKGWDGGKGTVENAIVDDELAVLLGAIRDRGAFVWFVADSCHSGTLTRGAGERPRYLPASVLIPPDVLASASPRRTRGHRPERLLARDMDGLVALYGAQPHELTPERREPDASGDWHGLFTYNLAAQLAEGGSRLTYRELADRLANRYRALGRTQPTPLIEGDLDRTVLGLERLPERPGIRLRRSAGGWRVEQGDLHGLTRGSVLAVYPPDGSGADGAPAGHVRVTALEPLEAAVEPVVARGSGWTTATGDLPGLEDGSRCAIVFRHFGDLKMKVGIQTQAGRGETAEVQTHPVGAGPAVLERLLSRVASSPRSLLEQAGEGSADWLVRLAGERVALVPASGWAAHPAAGHDDAGSRPGFDLGAITDPDALATALDESLSRIARAHHLRGLAAHPGRSGAHDVDVEIEIVGLRDSNDTVGAPVPFTQEGRVLRVGDYVGVRVTNPSRRAIDVTILFIDSGYGIRPLFPQANTTNRFRPGESHIVYRTRVTGATLGEEALVAIAVEGTGPLTSFTGFAQPTLALARSVTRGGRRHPLMELLDTALYAEGNTRGFGANEIGTYAVRLFTWWTLPAES